MLDMGFLPDVTKIIKKLPKERQTLLFSATMPNEIKKLANDFMNDPEKIEIEIEKPSGSITQKAYFVDQKEKLALVQNVLDDIEWESCLIFCATKRGVDELERLLVKKGIKAGSIHGDRDQSERNKSLHEFKSGKVPVIVATDVLARGIDIDDISLIINFDVPRQVEDYVHRIGRTGRYDKTGTAITFVNKKDSRAFSAIQDKVGDQLEILKANSQEGNSKGTSRKSSDTNKSDDKTRKNSKPEKKRKPSSKKESSDDNKSDGAKKPSSAGKKEINKKMNKKDIEDANRKVQNLDSVDVVLKGNNKNTRTSNSTSSRSSSKNRKQDTKKSQEPVIPAERIKKATKRNQNTPKPAKGLWGLIKSFFS